MNRYVQGGDGPGTVRAAHDDDGCWMLTVGETSRTSDYLRSLPPRDVSITQRLGGGGVVPLRVALPMLLQRNGGQDEADG